jgi:hypothetical protein
MDKKKSLTFCLASLLLGIDIDYLPIRFLVERVNKET